MPFDATLPANGTNVKAAELRGQFNALNDKIDAVPAGPQGPPFADAVVDAVSTLAPGSVATVGVSFDGTLVHLTYGIPAGVPGADGEMTDAALAAAIATSALNPSGIAPFAGTFSDPPTQAEMQAFAAWVETVRSAMVR